tara:strand:- start:4169 stop:4408 length:240 start_codon:yes stop_codon:yes gene_type:complete
MKKIILLAFTLSFSKFAISESVILNDVLKEKEEKIFNKNKNEISKKVECDILKKINQESDKKLLELKKKKEKKDFSFNN